MNCSRGPLKQRVFYRGKRKKKKRSGGMAGERDG